MRYYEVLAVILILGLGFLLVLPIPPIILDFVITLNIALSILMLASCLFTIRISNLLIFPTILLILTLLRIATNVATTRMILTQAYAGEIINTFGKVLIQGEVLVGLIIFSLISLVSLIIISRGALRISEVAARFTLDAMPTRQIAIEQEFKEGEISFREAQRKRDELRKESMLYGSMEGAMKFIQGDAIISVITVLINLGGGIFIGMKNKLTFQQALEKYSVLTVGDGLVAQIPALFLAISAGIIVSRVSSLANESILKETLQNIFSRKDTLLITGLVLLGISLIPGVPSISFFVIGFGFIVAGFLIPSKQTFYEKLDPSQIFLLEIPEVKLQHFSLDTLQEFSDRICNILSEVLNLPIPKIILSSSKSTEIYLKIKNRKYTISDLGSDKMLINAPIFYAQLFKDKDISEIRIPLSDMIGLVASASTKTKTFVSTLKISFFSNLEYVLLKAYETILTSPETFIDVTAVLNLLRDLSKSFPDLENIINSDKFLPVTKISSLIRCLLKNNLSINSYPLFVELINNLCLRYNQTRYDDTLTVEDVYTLLIEEDSGVLDLREEVLFDLVRFGCAKQESGIASVLDRNRKYGTVPLVIIEENSDSLNNLRVINQSKSLRIDPFMFNF